MSSLDRLFVVTGALRINAIGVWFRPYAGLEFLPMIE
jgi:hypothetical protein